MGSAVLPKNWVDKIIVALGFASLVYHLAYSQLVFTNANQHNNIHLGFALILVFLAYGRGKNRLVKYSGMIMAVISLIPIAYVAIFNDELQDRALFNTSIDLVMGVILIVLVLEATRRAIGIILPIVAICGVLYFFLGHNLSGPLQSPFFPPGKVISALSIGLTGLYGTILGSSARYIFLFVVFGAVLQLSGATEFFNGVGKFMARRAKAGPALSAVVSSALVGTTTGSVGANIMTVGSFTIPLMKRVGYRPAQAAAIEAAASNGGQIMPPVMGAAAFAMSAVTGIPYLDICLAAIIPAVLYFGVVGIYAQVQASKLSLGTAHEEVNTREILLRAPLFIIPLGVIIYLLIIAKPLMYCAFWGIVSAFVLSLIRKETRISPIKWVVGTSQGVILGAEIASCCALLGLVLNSLTWTALAVKLPGIAEAWSGGNILVLLLISAIVAIILGMGVSTLAVYLLVAMVCAPILLKVGVPLLQAHFFVFFCAVFAMVTPPVAPAAILASKLAGAPYLETSIEAVKSSLGGFILPFLIFWNPILLLQPSDYPTFVVVLRVMSCIAVLVALEIFGLGFFVRKLKIWERALTLTCAVIIFAGFIAVNNIFFLAGLAVLALVMISQLRAKSVEPAAAGNRS